MGLSVGIVGLPNVGKSTLFNSLSSKQAEAANYAFCTIDPNVGVVPVPDPRFDALVELFQPKKVVPATVDFVDIAAPDYDPAANQGLSYEAAMEEIHAILPDGTVVRGIEVFRRLYEEVGLGFVYAATKNEAVERAANRVYGFWARFRMQLTGRGDMAAVLAKRAAGDASTCRQGVGGGEPGAGSPP